jgi:hypothetical protein
MTTQRALPPIPDTVGAVLGPIRVLWVADLRDPDTDESLDGYWESDPRTIKLRSGQALEIAWWTLWHEWGHAVFFDTGTTLPEDDEENACDSIATARLLEMQGRSWTPRKRPPRKPAQRASVGDAAR